MKRERKVHYAHGNVDKVTCLRCLFALGKHPRQAEIEAERVGLHMRGAAGRVVGRAINLGSHNETGGTSSGTSTGGMHGRTNGDG